MKRSTRLFSLTVILIAYNCSVLWLTDFFFVRNIVTGIYIYIYILYITVRDVKCKMHDLYITTSLLQGFSINIGNCIIYMYTLKILRHPTVLTTVNYSLDSCWPSLNYYIELGRKDFWKLSGCISNAGFSWYFSVRKTYYDQ